MPLFGPSQVCCTYSTVLPAPIETVFELLDPARCPEWDPGLESMRPLNADGPASGVLYEVRTAPGPLGQQVNRETLIRWEPPFVRAVQGRQGPNVHYTVTMSLRAIDGARTLLIEDSRVELRGLWKLTKPAVRAFVRSHQPSAYGKLRDFLVATGRASASAA